MCCDVRGCVTCVAITSHIYITVISIHVNGLRRHSNKLGVQCVHINPTCGRQEDPNSNDPIFPIHKSGFTVDFPTELL